LRYLTFKRNDEKTEIIVYTNNVKKSIETILLKAKETRDILKYNEDILKQAGSIPRFFILLLYFVIDRNALQLFKNTNIYSLDKNKKCDIIQLEVIK